MLHRMALRVLPSLTMAVTDEQVRKRKRTVMLIAGVAAFAMAATVLAVLASPGGRTWVTLAVGAIAALAILLGGFQVAWSHVVCQPTGQSGGSVAGLFGGSGYDCNDGVLTFR